MPPNAGPDLKAFQQLDAKFAAKYNGRLDTDLGLRLTRAIRWGLRAERELQYPDYDAAFVFYWISFNAAYGVYNPDRSQEAECTAIGNYFSKLQRQTHFLPVEKLVRDDCWDIVRKAINNPYLYKKFWNQQHDADRDANWRTQLERDCKSAANARAHGDCIGILRVMFERLYVLRNQLLHGGASHNSSANRDQVKDGAHIMAHLIPRFVELMMDHDDKDWGVPYYPLVGAARPPQP